MIAYILFLLFLVIGWVIHIVDSQCKYQYLFEGILPLNQYSLRKCLDR